MYVMQKENKSYFNICKDGELLFDRDFIGYKVYSVMYYNLL